MEMAKINKKKYATETHKESEIQLRHFTAKRHSNGANQSIEHLQNARYFHAFFIRFTV